MLVSIAVPSLNQGRFLRACLSSIQRQSHSHFEVLIADGGSRDDSLAIVDRFTSSDPRFRLISTVDAGQADAVQKAFHAASGDILCYLNADDCYISENALALAVERLVATPAASLVSFGGMYLDASGRPTRRVRLRYHPLDSARLMRWRTAVLQPATFWRRAVHEQIPLRTDLHFAFDVFFFFDAYQRFGWIESDEIVAGYRLHGRNKSSGVKAARIRELAAFERHKFGRDSTRALYLDAVARFVGVLDGVPLLGAPVQRVAYLVVNSVSFATVYRLPGI